MDSCRKDFLGGRRRSSSKELTSAPSKRARGSHGLRTDCGSGRFVFPDALVFHKNEYILQLSDTQRRLWLHDCIAPRRAAQHYEPMSQYRALGVMRRQLTMTEEHGTLRAERQRVSRKPSARNERKPSAVSKALLNRLARADALRSGKEKSEEELALDAEQIRIDWQQSAKRGHQQPFWDEFGEICHLLGEGDEHVISITALIREMQNNRIVDEQHKNEIRHMYGGIQHVPVDTLTVLKALGDIQQPLPDLYDIPMLVCYPRLTLGRLEIGVYASRLLFEIMTFDSLKCIFAAFDEDSVNVVQPLVYPRPSSVPVFASDDRVIVYEKEQDTNDTTIQGATDETEKLYAFSNGGFLRLCENHGCETSNWTEIKSKIESRLKIDLMLHQVHGICWMHSMEHLNGGLNSILWEQRAFPDGGSYFYSPALGQLRLFLGAASDKPTAAINGGILCDEMGLGKTIQTLTLILATLDKLKEEARTKEDHTHATLIVVPPALVSQWLSEIEKVTNDLVVVLFDHKNMRFETKSKKQGEADIVLTTYNSLEIRRSWAKDSSRLLKTKSWGRIVLDEMQEIRSGTSVIAKNCEELRSNRRWMLSGTPLFEGIDDLRGELCFLKLEPFAGNCEDVFFDFAVKSRWESESQDCLEVMKILSLVMLRRSKSMTIVDSGHPILGLKPLKVVFEPVAQDESERAVYCFLEWVVQSTIHGDSHEKGNYRKWIRLLREACISCVLLTGGLGCPSQLASINRLVVAMNRREVNEGLLTKPISSGTPLSCDDAIRFLSQIAAKARVPEGYVTDVALGAGGGAARRVRAAESVEEQLKETEEHLFRVNHTISQHQSKRSKSNWHRLLELVTTGYVSTGAFHRVQSKFRRLWLWRRAFLSECHKPTSGPLPEMLTRGWRPRQHLLRPSTHTRAQLRWQWAVNQIRKTKCPSTSAARGTYVEQSRGIIASGALWLFSEWLYAWAHPHCMLLSHIPAEVTSDDIRCALLSCLSEDTTGIYVAPVRSSSIGTNWSTYVVLRCASHYSTVERTCRRVNGLGIQSKIPLSSVEDEISAATDSYEKALAECKVYACPANLDKLRGAKRRLQSAKLGLRIMAKESCRPPHICCSPSMLGRRNCSRQKAHALLSRLDMAIDDSTTTLSAAILEKEILERKLERLKVVAQNGKYASISATSAFEILQLLKKGEFELAPCPVCLNPMGDRETSGGVVAVTPCGHLFCRDCLSTYVSERGTEVNTAPCISCRKPISSSDVLLVDPSSNSAHDTFETLRLTASAKIRQAATLLEKSNGQLPAEMWEALYLSINPPDNAHLCADPIHTALPALFLAHLTKLLNAHRDVEDSSTFSDISQVSSKIRALIDDLPRDERSVVFASSKQTVKLVMRILSNFNIGCRCLYNGQKEEDSERAVKEWRQSKDVFVLLVQSGAAACGLTLTDASKLFLLEPLSKHEEERQAYARLHRYGQTGEVICKVYFAPVTVEERLLEWRKRVSCSKLNEAQVSFAPLRDELVTELSDEDEMNQILLDKVTW